MNSKQSLIESWYNLGYANGRNGATYNPPKHKDLIEHFNKGMADGLAIYESQELLTKQD